MLAYYKYKNKDLQEKNLKKPKETYSNKKT